MKATAPFGFRYQYLAAGVNTGQGWATWSPDGQFVTSYIQESIEHGIIPAFSYYMLLQSAPGNTLPEPEGNYTNLQDAVTMTAYYNDLKLFFVRAGAFPSTLVILHVEPDLWAYLQQRATGDDASTVPAKVAATGLSELADLPDNASGFARAVVRLRDAYAPHVLLGYDVKDWGTQTDIILSNPADATVDALGARAGRFYLSLEADFDLAFGTFSDRDAAFYQYVSGDGGRRWWDAADFRRNVRFLAKFVDVAQKRVVMWSIPYGNTKMRAMNNTWNHYQDNVVEALLDDPSRAYLNAYARAGVIAFLFGRGAHGATCACDAAGDGVTDPEPINGNTGLSSNADDDGGFFRQKASEYYAAGTIALPSTDSPPAVVPLPAVGPAPPAMPRAGLSTSARVAPENVAGGETVAITASITSATEMMALVDVEVHSPAGTRVFQQSFDNQPMTPGQRSDYPVTWQAPATAQGGTYIVKVGVFSPGWGTLHTWNDVAAEISISAAPGS